MSHTGSVKPIGQLQSYGSVQFAAIGHPGCLKQSAQPEPKYPILHLQIGDVLFKCAKIQVPRPLTQAGWQSGRSHNGPVYPVLQMHPCGVCFELSIGSWQYPPMGLHPFRGVQVVQLTPSHPGLHLHWPGATQ